jgi:hypothetical protein
MGGRVEVVVGRLWWDLVKCSVNKLWSVRPEQAAISSLFPDLIA